jgi:hypothetical protein
MGNVTGAVTGSYPYHRVINLNAAPASGVFHFVQWSDDINNTNPSRQITLVKDTTITAIFDTTGFDVDLYVNDQSWGSVTGDGNYNINKVIQIAATPNTDYVFVQWNDGDTNNPRTVTVLSDTNFTAQFDTIRYDVTLTVNDPLMGIVTGYGNYPIHAEVSIEAIAETDYRFLKWDDGDLNNPRDITVLSDTSFTAEFIAIGFYRVTVLSADEIMGSVTGEGTYEEDTEAEIEAIPEAGYRFVQWNDGETYNPRTITVTQDSTLVAEFEAIMHHIIVTVNDSAMGTVTGEGDYQETTMQTITAIANAGYRFVQWNDGVTDNPRTINITDGETYTAIFVETGYYLVTTASNDDEMGTVTGEGDYQQNTDAEIEAIPEAGYRFVQWNDGDIDNPRTFTVTQDTNFIATFEAIMHLVTVTANDTTMGTLTGEGYYQETTTAEIEAIPNQKVRFVQWNDGVTDNPRIITVWSDTTFIAEFDTIKYHITLLVNDPTMGTVTGEGDYVIDDMATITAIPNPDYQFVRWDDGNVNSTRTVSVTSDITYTAEFERKNTIATIELSKTTIYPNPAIDKVNIILPENVSQAFFTLYDMQGKELIRKEINGQDNVEVSVFAAGIYVYKLTTPKESHTGKLTVKK